MALFARTGSEAEASRGLKPALQGVFIGFGGL
jgi:hypothetical protein